VPLADDLGVHLAGAPAVARGGSNERAVVPLVFDNALAVIDLKTGRASGKIKTGGVAPFGAVISRDGRTAWVSNWGGRWPASGDVTLPTGLAAGADRVVVDQRGIASTGTIARIDLDQQKVTHAIDVGLHPTAMAWDESRHRLFVATIFVVEDDAQNGVDHVDGHRTVALAISPYIRRGVVDSTFYAHQSMVKTIELMLGLPTMSLFDLIATDMRASFTTVPDPRPYAAVQPTQSLFERNPKLSAMTGPLRKAALDSQRMRFDQPDAAPTERLNRIVWGLVKGWNQPYPAVRKGAFSPLSIDLEDEEREEKEERRERR
jgi:Phosphoesterase family